MQNTQDNDSPDIPSWNENVVELIRLAIQSAIFMHILGDLSMRGFHCCNFWQGGLEGTEVIGGVLGSE